MWTAIWIFYVLRKSKVDFSKHIVPFENMAAERMFLHLAKRAQLRRICGAMPKSSRTATDWVFVWATLCICMKSRLDRASCIRKSIDSNGAVHGGVVLNVGVADLVGFIMTTFFPTTWKRTLGKIEIRGWELRCNEMRQSRVHLRQGKFTHRNKVLMQSPLQLMERLALILMSLIEVFLLLGIHFCSETGSLASVT